MKTKKSLDKIKTTCTTFEDFPSVKKVHVLGRVKQEENGSLTYQGMELRYYNRGKTYLKSHTCKNKYVEALEA